MKRLCAYFYNAPVPLSPNCVFSRLGSTYNALLTDRFNFLNKYSRWNVAVFDDKLPSIRPELDYKEICLSRGKELAEQYPDGIALAYSGGVDSVGMVAVFVLLGYPLEKLHIIGNSHSVEEYPYAYEWFKNNKVKITMGGKNQFTTHYDNIPERVILTGHCNDQFFHVGTVYSNLKKQLIPIEDGLRWLYGKYNHLQYLDFDLDLIQQYSKLVGWEVHDLFDLSVLINFGCRYKFVQKHIPFHSKNIDTQKKFLSFYDNQDFQDWALTNREQNKEYYKLSLQDNSFYKRVLKELIYEVFKDDEFLKNKGKEGSWVKREVDLGQRGRMASILGVWDESGLKVRFYNPLLHSHRYLYERKKLFQSFFYDYLKF